MTNILTPSQVRSYLQKALHNNVSLNELGSKLNSIKVGINWAVKNKYLEPLVFEEISEILSNFEKIHLIKPLQQKSFTTRTKERIFTNFKKFRSYSLLPQKSSQTEPSRYIGALVLIIFTSVLAAGFYTRFFIKPTTPFAYPTSLTKGGRVLSFQGRLTDSLGNPITTSTNVQFKLYTASSGGSPLYSTGSCAVIPDQDGIFNTLIGSSCGTEIDTSVFTENTTIYMGTTVGSDTEMAPRQQIANVGYAINAETLQGLPPGTNASNIPYINKDGDMLINVTSPGIRSSYGSANFNLTSALGINIQSANTGDITLNASQSGTLLFKNSTHISTFDTNGDLKIGGGTFNNSSGSEDLYITGNLEADGVIYGNGSGLTSVGQANITADSLDFTEFQATLDLDGSLTLNQGTGTWAQNFTGTTGPAVTYTASGAVGTGNAAGIELNISNTSTSVPAFLLRYAGSSYALRVNDDGTTTDTSPFVIDASGNTGIGTTAPGQKLDVQGAVRLGANGNANDVLNTTSGSAPSGNLFWGNRTVCDSSNNCGTFVSGTGTTNYLARWTSGSALGIGTIYDTGSLVGIGTTAPGSKLTVSGGLAVGTTSVSSTYLTKAAPDGGAIFEGNVGIGTTSPGAKLDVAGTLTQVGTANLNVTGTAASSIGNNTGTLALVGGASSTIDFSNFDVATTGNITVAAGQGLDTNAAGALNLGNGTATSINIGNTAATTINIGAGGNLTRTFNIGTGTGADTINIGVGTTTADTINIGTGAVANTIAIGSSSTTTLSLTDNNWNISAAGAANFVSIGATTRGSGQFTTLDANGNVTIGDAAGDSVTVNSAAWTFANDTNVTLTGGTAGLNFDTNTLSIDATNDRIGIGTTAPSQALDLAAANANLTFSSATGPHQILTGGSTNLALMPGGSVGIGTTAPGQKLDVQGAVRLGANGNANDVLNTTSGSAPSGNLFWGNRTLCDSTGSCSYTGGSGTANYITKWATASTLGNAIIYDTGTALGIGTTAPGSKLTISGGLSVGTTSPSSTYLSKTAPDGGAIFEGNVGIGTTNPGNKLTLAGTSDAIQFVVRANGTQTISNPLIQLQNSSGTALLSINSNTASNGFIGVGAGQAISSGTNDVFIGYQSGYNTNTGYSNTGIGPSTLFTNADGHSNTAIGPSALYSNTSGFKNTAIGPNALYTNSTSFDNVAIGPEALYNNSTGSYNVAIGSQAAKEGSARSGLVAIGLGALQTGVSGVNSTAVGSYAGYSNTGNDGFFGGYQSGYSVTGGNGVYLGTRAGYNQGTGTNNVMIGMEAGRGAGAYNASGNVFLGYQAGYNETRSNKLYIENSNSTSPLIYGDFSSDILGINGSLGIGTTAPNAKLTLANNVATGFLDNYSEYQQILYDGGSASSSYGLGIKNNTIVLNSGGGAYSFDRGGSATTMFMDTSGNVGIGTTSPSNKLDVQGNAMFGAGTYYSGAIINAGNISVDYPGNNGWNTTWNSNILLSGQDSSSISFHDSALRVDTLRVAAGQFNIGENVGWGTANTRMYGNTYIDGNVGIGTTNPAQKLSVVSGNPASPFSGVALWSGASNQYTAYTIGRTVGTVDGYFAVSGSAGAYANDSASGDVMLLSNGAKLNLGRLGQLSTMTLSGSSVGIGTTSPSYRLDVRGGDINTSGVYRVGGVSGASGSCSVNEEPVGPSFTSGLLTNWGGCDLGNSTDLAESYPSRKALDKGDIVETDSFDKNYIKASSTDDSRSLIGIVTTHPWKILGEKGDVLWKTVFPIALNGRVPAKVMVKNSMISTGDPITSSSLHGYGKKLTDSGVTVGKALESTVTWNDATCPLVSSIDDISWPSDNGNNENKPCFKLPDNTYIGKIMVFVNTSWYEPTAVLTSSGDYTIGITQDKEMVYNGNLNDAIADNSSIVTTVVNNTGNTINTITGFAKVVSGKIQTGLIDTQNAVVKGTLVATNTITETLQSTTVKTTSLIASTINSDNVSVSNKFSSPIVETDNLKVHSKAEIAKVETNVIKPQSNDLTIDLNTSPTPVLDGEAAGPLAKLLIKGREGRNVASIDAEGNASFSGTIAASQVHTGSVASSDISSDTLTVQTGRINSLEGSEASLSGKLVAKEVSAENIEKLASDVNSVQKLLADLKDQPVANPTYYQNIPNDVDWKGTNIIASGNTNLYNASVTNIFTAGNVMIDNNSILALASDLRLSSLSTITLFDNAVVIAKDGTITTQGTIIAKKGIKTNAIQAADPSKDVSVILGTAGTPESDSGQARMTNQKLAITDSLGVEVASIDASGSAHFNDIALNKYVDATSSATVIASAQNFAQNGIFAPAIETNLESAGIGIIPATEMEVIIYNKNISDNTLIYLTPNQSIPNGQLSVIEKNTCVNSTDVACKPYFKVSSGTMSDKDLKFNWLIIN